MFSTSANFTVVGNGGTDVSTKSGAVRGIGPEVCFVVGLLSG